MDSIKNFICIKNLEQYKKLPLATSVKKRAFCKTFHSTQNLLQLQCLVDDSVDCYKYQCLSMFLYLECII